MHRQGPGVLTTRREARPPPLPVPVSLPFPPPRTLDRSAGCATGFPASWPPRRPHDERALPRRARSGGVRSGGAPSSNSGRRRSFSPEPFPAGANLTRAFRPLDCVISFVGLPTESSLCLSSVRALPHYLCIRKSAFFVASRRLLRVMCELSSRSRNVCMAHRASIAFFCCAVPDYLPSTYPQYGGRV